MSTEQTLEELIAEHDELLNQMAHFETWKQECPMSWDVHGYERVKNRLAWVEDKLAELTEPNDNETARGKNS